MAMLPTDISVACRHTEIFAVGTLKKNHGILDPVSYVLNLSTAVRDDIPVDVHPIGWGPVSYCVHNQYTGTVRQSWTTR